jgi:dipeptidyl aminopeptidase/acylaminoacyl peptidase
LRLIKNPEHKGILILLGIALLIGLGMAAVTGKLTEWTGIRLSLRAPLRDAIVYVSNAGGHPDIWVMKPDGTGKKALTNDEFVDKEPIVSPDGDRIAFISAREGSYSQIFVMNSDGSRVRRLTHITGNKSCLSFSNDGRSVIFLCGGSVWQALITEDHPERLLPTEAQAAAERSSGAGERQPYLWAEESPDGSALAAIRLQEGHQVAYWMRHGDPQPIPIADPEQLGGAPFAGETVNASWAHSDLNLVLTGTLPKAAVIAIASMADGKISPMSVKVPIGHPDWSADGTYVVCEVLKQLGPDDYHSTGLVVFDVTKGAAQMVAKGDARRPKWSPDSTKIVFADGDKIAVVDGSSGETKVLSDDKAKDSDPSWAPASEQK